MARRLSFNSRELTLKPLEVCSVFCFKALGDKDNARIILQRVIDKYPNTPQSDIARNELKKLLYNKCGTCFGGRSD